MTGPEHYAEAEQLLAHAADPQSGRPRPAGPALSPAVRAAMVAEAHVHATLALAAATALAELETLEYIDAWLRTAWPVTS